LVPILFLLFNAIYFKNVTKQIEEALVAEKNVAMHDLLDMMFVAVQANPDRDWEEHEKNIQHSIRFVDSLYMVFAAAYKPNEDCFDLVLITERNYATNFNPLEFDRFQTAIHEADSGDLVISFIPTMGVEEGNVVTYHLYFRWMPMYTPANQRYLLVTGVSKHSVVTRIPILISAGQWVNTFITFALNATMIVIVIHVNSEYNKYKLTHKGSDKDEDSSGE